MAIRYFDYSDIAAFAVGGDFIEALGEVGGASGRWTAKGDQNAHTRQFEVVTKDNKFGDVVVGKCLMFYGIYPGNTYQRPDTGEDDLSSRCTTVSVNQDAQNMTHWTCSAEYGPFTWAGIADGGDPSNPLDLIPVPVVVEEPFEFPMWKDYSDTAVLNSAGDPSSPPQTRTLYKKVLIYERNEQDYSAALADTWIGKANLTTWNTYEPKKIACRSITGTPDFHPLIGIYYKVRYEFELWDGVTGPDAATRWVADAGWYEVVSGEKTKILNDDNTEPAEIPFLDGSGVKLPAGGTVVFNPVQYRDTVDFTGLDITLP